MKGEDWIVVSRLKEEALGRRKETMGEGRKGAQGGGETGTTVQEGQAIAAPTHLQACCFHVSSWAPFTLIHALPSTSDNSVPPVKKN